MSLLPSLYRVFEDEIQQLRDQLRETADENGRLYKLLKERDFEIKHLKKKIEEDRFAFTGRGGGVLPWSPGTPVLLPWGLQSGTGITFLHSGGSCDHLVPGTPEMREWVEGAPRGAEEEQSSETAQLG